MIPRPTTPRRFSEKGRERTAASPRRGSPALLAVAARTGAPAVSGATEARARQP